jgi:hypothetical protein
MPNRVHNWLNQAVRDLGQAENSRTAGRHQWASPPRSRRRAGKAVHPTMPSGAVAGDEQTVPLEGLPDRHADSGRCCWRSSRRSSDATTPSPWGG